MKMLHRWHIEPYRGNGPYIVWGHVTGNEQFEEGTWIHTSRIIDITHDETNELLSIRTKNSVYLCPLREWRLDRQAAVALPPEFEPLVLKYSGCTDYPMEKDSILVAFSTGEPLFLDDAVADENGQRIRFSLSCNCGMFVDTCHLRAKGRLGNDYGIDYYIRGITVVLIPRNICELPLVLFNTGQKTISIMAEYKNLLLGENLDGCVKIRPGERKTVIEARTNRAQDAMDKQVSEEQARKSEEGTT